MSKIADDVRAILMEKYVGEPQKVADAESYDATPYFMAPFMTKFAEAFDRDMTDLEVLAFRNSFGYHLYEKTANSPVLRSAAVGAGLGGLLGAGSRFHRMRKALKEQGYDLPLSQLLKHPVSAAEMLATLGAQGAVRGGATVGGIAALLKALKGM